MDDMIPAAMAMNTAALAMNEQDCCGAQGLIWLLISLLVSAAFIGWLMFVHWWNFERGPHPSQDEQAAIAEQQMRDYFERWKPVVKSVRT